MTYLATAYRWGWTNAHTYVVYCGNDYDRALELAEEENNDRAGKYGVDVRQYDEEGDWQMLLAYFKSSYGEDMPHHNYRLDYFNTLGHMMDEYVNGTFYEVQEGGTVLQRTTIEPDPRIVERARSRKEFYDALQEGLITRGEDNGNPQSE